MTTEEISYKDLSRSQLDALKELYVNSRLSSMDVNELRKVVKDVLELQVTGTVGNQEEREVWKEMKEHFNEKFEEKIKEVITAKNSQDTNIDPEEKELQKRLDVLEKRKQEEKESNEDMW